MATPSGVRMGQAFVELFADDSRLVRGLRNASRRLKAWGQSVTAVGQRMLTAGMAAMGGALGSSKVFASMGDTMAKASQRTGISVERLSELAYAAEQSGTDLTALESGVRRMQRTIVEAASGSQTAQEALANLGLSVQQLAGLSPDQQFAMLADRIAAISDPTQRAATAMEVFGRSGTQLLPMMAEGSAGIDALAQRARDLGLVMSTEDAEAAVVFGDLVSDLWKTLRMGAFTIGAALAPVLKELVEQIISVVKHVSDWIKENKETVATIVKVAAAITVGGAAFIALGSALSGLGSAFGVLATVAKGVGTALGAIGAVLGAILSPIGIVATAVASLGAYLLYVSGAGEKALGWLGEQFATLQQTASAAWKGIADALAAGDIALAAKILWLTLRKLWLQGVAWITEKWVGIKDAVMSVVTEIQFGIARMLTSWVEVVGVMAKAWTIFTHHFRSGWRSVQNWIAKKFVALMAYFDKSIDVEAAQKILDEDFAREQAQRDEATQQELREIDERQKARRAELDAETRNTLEALDEEQARRNKERKEAYAKELQQTKDAAAQAQAEWEEALKAAAQKRAEVAKNAPPPAQKKPGELKPFDLDVDFETPAKRAITVVGTFNPLAAMGLSTGGPWERTAKATEETAKNTKQLVKQAQQGSLVFA